MKGVVFTIDAVFAIMITAIAISILLYFHYTPITQDTLGFSSLTSLSYLLSSVTLGNFTASPLAVQMSGQYTAVNQTWPEFYQGNSNNASNGYGPNTDSLLLTYNASGGIYPNSLIAGEGQIFVVSNYTDPFAPLGHFSVLSGLASYYHSYLTESGADYMSFNTSITDITADLVYKNALIYTNKTALMAVSTWVQYNAIPPSGTVSAHIIGYDNMILVPIYTSSNSAETGISGFYANNGTKAWTINTGGEVNSIAIVSGSVAAEVGNTIKVFAFQSNGGIPFSLYNKSYNYNPTSMVVYNGLPFVADSASYSGISVYNNTLFYQSISNYTSAQGNVESGSWKVYMPPYVGSSPAGGQPISSNGNLYTVWSNKYIVDQNTYNGAIKWIIHIPYQGAVSPHMILAYGMLFVTVGNTLLGFGSCQGYPNKSLLSNMVTLYLNYESGCADALLSTAYPEQNTSLIVNNSFHEAPALLEMYPYVMNFTTAYIYGSHIDIGNNSALSPEAGSSGRTSMCIWYRINSLSNYYGPLIKGKSPPSSGNAWEYTFDQEGYDSGAYTHPSFTVWSSSGTNIAYGEANAITFNSMVNNWSFACFTYDYPGQKSYYYFDGVRYNATMTNSNGPATAGTGSLIIGAGENPSNPTGGTGYSAVSVADMQMYSIILTPSQIRTLYQQGITASPIQSDGLVGWWPLAGDANDYSGNGHTGFPYNVISANAGFISPDYLNSYETQVSMVPVTAESGSLMPYVFEYLLNGELNYTYTAGVYTWK